MDRKRSGDAAGWNEQLRPAVVLRAQVDVLVLELYAPAAGQHVLDAGAHHVPRGRSRGLIASDETGAIVPQHAVPDAAPGQTARRVEQGAIPAVADAWTQGPEPAHS